MKESMKRIQLSPRIKDAMASSPMMGRNCAEGDDGGWIKVRHDKSFKWKKAFACVDHEEVRAAFLFPFSLPSNLLLLPRSNSSTG